VATAAAVLVLALLPGGETGERAASDAGYVAAELPSAEESLLVLANGPLADPDEALPEDYQTLASTRWPAGGEPDEHRPPAPATVAMLAGAARAFRPAWEHGPAARAAPRRAAERHAERLCPTRHAAGIRAADARASSTNAGRRCTRRLEMRERLGEEAPDRDAVMELADRIGAAETALDKHRLATLLEIRALLTPTQRQELVRIFGERRRARHEAKIRGLARP
jgi:Spy/CpxP family protein refolding chaperone